MTDPTDDSVAAHYDAIASSYHERYDANALLTAEKYPANYFRLQLLLDAFAHQGIKRVVEVS